MKEYGMDVTVNYPNDEKDMPFQGWFPSVGTLAAHIMELIEKEPEATSFVFSVVQRKHVP